MLAGTSLGEEGLEGVIPKGLVGGHVTIGLDAMLQAVQLPASITNLDTGLNTGQCEKVLEMILEMGFRDDFRDDF